MANGYSYLLEDFGNWAANIPDPGMTSEGGNQATDFDWTLPDNLLGLPTGEDITDSGTFEYWEQAAPQSWATVMLPLAQLLSNNQQFKDEFDEAQRRFNEQFEWTQQRDQFQMGLSERQQSASEQQALWGQENWQSSFGETQLNNQVARDEALRRVSLAEQQQEIESGQWQRSFEAEQINDAHARSLADQRLAFEQDRSNRELTIAEQRQIWEKEYQTQQLELERQSLETQEQIAAMQAFGRSSAPSAGGARWVSNWG